MIDKTPSSHKYYQSQEDLKLNVSFAMKLVFVLACECSSDSSLPREKMFYSNGKCYSRSPTKGDYATGQAFCARGGAHMAMAKDAQGYEAFKAMFARKKTSIK